MAPSPEKLNELGLSPPTGNVQAPVFNEPDGVKPGMYPPMSPMSSEMGSVMPPGQIDWTGPSMTPPFGQGQQPLNPAPETLADLGIMPGGGSAQFGKPFPVPDAGPLSPMGPVSALMPSPAPGHMVGMRAEPSGPVPQAPEIAGRLAVQQLSAPNQPPEWTPPAPMRAPQPPWQDKLKGMIGLSQYGPEGRGPMPMTAKDTSRPGDTPGPFTGPLPPLQGQQPGSLAPLALQSMMPTQRPQMPAPPPPPQQPLAFMPGQQPNWWELQGLSGGLSPFAGFSGGGGLSFGGGDW